MDGYCGNMLFVDFTNGNYEERPLTPSMAEQYIGGYGIGAKVLFDTMKPGVDPLGPENVIGFTTGPLTGTGALLSGRYMVVCKSPVTGGWNDSNSGGSFGPELKKAGFDALFIRGAAERPVYLWINDGKVEIRDAAHLWAKDVVATEAAIKAELDESRLRVATVGPAGEKMSLMAAVMNDGHRAAGRGGSGAVMGSKNLKAVVVRGTGSVAVADPEKLKSTNQEVLSAIKNGPMAPMIGGFSQFGTSGIISGAAMSGDSPVKNWDGVGIVDYDEEKAKTFDGPAMDPKYREKNSAVPIVLLVAVLFTMLRMANGRLEKPVVRNMKQPARLDR
jgi:aldehyde:ferredoxin oxidoreductase